jgi:hypothetical protein
METQRLELKPKEKEGDKIIVFTAVSENLGELPRDRVRSRAD